MYRALDHGCGSESPSFDSLNERLYDSDYIHKIFASEKNKEWGACLPIAGYII